MTDASQAIARLRELRAKATPAPWQARKEAYDDDAWERQYVYHASDEHTEWPCAWPLGGHREDANAAAIVAAMNALPALLDAAEALDFVLSAHGEQLHTAFEQAHAALAALAEGGGE